jgi:hypothetical protein
MIALERVSQWSSFFAQPKDKKATYSKSNSLKCTVFMAATSHPNDCMTNVAMVFPTYLTCTRRQYGNATKFDVLHQLMITSRMRRGEYIPVCNL